MLDVNTVEIENLFDKLQDIIKKILVEEYSLTEEESNSFVDELISDNSTKVKDIFDKSIKLKKIDEIALDIINLFYDKTKINNTTTNDLPNELMGDRTLNKNERIYLSFKDFVNEKINLNK